MTNKEIRRRAWELCREKFGLILSATFLMSLISMVTMEISSWIESPVLALIPTIFLMILSEIMSIGIVRFMLDIWHGETPKLSVLFSQKHRFWTYVGYNLLTTLIVVAIIVAALLPATFFEESIVLPVITILVGIVVLFWILIRFEMTLTCMVIRSSYSTTDCMRTAWRASKGNVRRLLCNMLVLNLPLFIAQGLLSSYQLYLITTGQTLNTIGSILLSAGSVLISALLSGYIYLGSNSLHEQLLENYLSTHPEKNTAEMWTELPASDEEYEDIPEDEEEETSSTEN